MADEFCPECGAKITGNTGFCPECGAVTTSLKNQIEEAERIKREEKEKQAEHNRQAREKRINFIKKNKYYIIGFLILIISIAIVANVIISSDTSNREYNDDKFKVEYPHNYSQNSISEYFKVANVGRDGVEFTETGYDNIRIYHFDSNGMSLKDYLKYAKKELVDSIGSDHWFYDILSVDKINIDGIEGYHLIEKDTSPDDGRSNECYIFIKDGECYWIWVDFTVEEEYKNIVLDSFKFK